MTERQSKVLEYIKLQSDINKIKEELNLTDKDLIRVLNALNDKGYIIKEGFDVSGKHQFRILKRPFTPSSGKIEITGEKDTISFIGISDTHLLSDFASLESLDLVYDYAAKNGINYILHAGDLIHDEKIPQKKFERNIETLMKTYPSDKSITTFLIEGNHDYTAIDRYGLDIRKIISSSRLDLKPIGIEKGYVQFNHAIIKLQHESKSTENSAHMILKGHSHIYKLAPYINQKKVLGIMVQLPSLSDMKMRNHRNILEKGFVKIDLHYRQNKVLDTANIEQYMVDEKILKLGEMTHQFRKVK